MIYGAGRISPQRAQRTQSPEGMGSGSQDRNLFLPLRLCDLSVSVVKNPRVASDAKEAR
jgi:hypothetical protein